MSESIIKSAAGQYLVVELAHEEYGVPVVMVREIVKISDITVWPQTPLLVRGSLDLRGRVMPIVDLRLKFGVPSEVYTDRTCIIVSEVERAGQPTLLGMVVDGVCEVLSISANDLEAVPDVERSVDTGYMRDVAKVNGTVKLLVGLDRLLSADVRLESAA